MLKRPASQAFASEPFKGLIIYICAVPLLAASSGSRSDEIFCKAFASPEGCLVKRTPDASAKSSLRLCEGARDLADLN